MIDSLPSPLVASRLSAVALVLVLCLAGCAKQPKVIVMPPPPPPAPAGPLDLNGAAQYVAAELARFRPATASASTVTIDSIIHEKTCQETDVTRKLGEALAVAIPGAMTGVTVVPFAPDDLDSAKLVLTGSLSALPEKGDYLVKVALTDAGSRQVVSQSAARFSAPDLSDAPTRFHVESRAVMCDQAAITEIEASEKKTGESASESYMGQLPTSTLLERAQASFDSGRWQDALRDFTAAAGRVEGQQLRTYSGIWTSHWNLGRTTEAETAYGNFVRKALATNTLKVMPYFAPGRFDVFFPEADTRLYAMMIRQIGRTAQDMKVCLKIVGHTSRTGNEADNQTLSERRAGYVRDLIEKSLLAGRQFASRPEVSGVGSREVLNGAAVDDASTAVDRRVEFVVIACGAGK